MINACNLLMNIYRVLLTSYGIVGMTTFHGIFEKEVCRSTVPGQTVPPDHGYCKNAFVVGNANAISL
jgi:hypothetical protein